MESKITYHKESPVKSKPIFKERTKGKLMVFSFMAKEYLKPKERQSHKYKQLTKELKEMGAKIIIKSHVPFAPMFGCYYFVDDREWFSGLCESEAEFTSTTIRKMGKRDEIFNFLLEEFDKTEVTNKPGKSYLRLHRENGTLSLSGIKKSTEELSNDTSGKYLYIPLTRRDLKSVEDFITKSLREGCGNETSLLP